MTRSEEFNFVIRGTDGQDSVAASQSSWDEGN